MIKLFMYNKCVEGINAAILGFKFMVSYSIMILIISVLSYIAGFLVPYIPLDVFSKSAVKMSSEHLSSQLFGQLGGGLLILVMVGLLICLLYGLHELITDNYNLAKNNVKIKIKW